MKNILILMYSYLAKVFSQTVYEVNPGTKSNEIKLTVANVSETNQATNVNVVLTKKSSSLVFSKEKKR